MCLTIKSKKKPIPRVAKRNITVWKVLESWADGSLVSPFCNEPYDVGKKKLARRNGKPMRTLYPIQRRRDYAVVPHGSSILWLVNEGIHAHVDKERPTTWVSEDESIYKAIIPKGAKYLRGRDEEIVSTALIVLGKVTE